MFTDLKISSAVIQTIHQLILIETAVELTGKSGRIQ